MIIMKESAVVHDERTFAADLPRTDTAIMNNCDFLKSLTTTRPETEIVSAYDTKTSTLTVRTEIQKTQ